MHAALARRQRSGRWRASGAGEAGVNPTGRRLGSLGAPAELPPPSSPPSPRADAHTLPTPAADRVHAHQPGLRHVGKLTWPPCVWPATRVPSRARSRARVCCAAPRRAPPSHSHVRGRLAAHLSPRAEPPSLRHGSGRLERACPQPSRSPSRAPSRSLAVAPRHAPRAAKLAPTSASACSPF